MFRKKKKKKEKPNNYTRFLTLSKENMGIKKNMLISP